MRSPWFIPVKRLSGPVIRLFCLPFAGGTAAAYRAWAAYLPNSVEIVPVELPARGMRFSETPFVSSEPLIEALAEAIQPYLDTPFALFGHSMGALLSFELARLLSSRHGVTPAHLFVSGHRAPHLEATDTTTHLLSDQDLLIKVRQIDGTPKEVLEQHELMQLMLPILRADFTICDTYVFQPGAPLPCSISAFGGFQDPMVKRNDIAAWREHTSAEFFVHMFPGGHFFLQTSQVAFIKTLVQDLAQILTRL
ncbi:MAG: thioesterase [Herpetosiphonaceae bacterium]|nr:thioesterase [Herpetosiphonaceae bacterium]